IHIELERLLTHGLGVALRVGVRRILALAARTEIALAARGGLADFLLVGTLATMWAPRRFHATTVPFTQTISHSWAHGHLRAQALYAILGSWLRLFASLRHLAISPCIEA